MRIKTKGGQRFQPVLAVLVRRLVHRLVGHGQPGRTVLPSACPGAIAGAASILSEFLTLSLGHGLCSIDLRADLEAQAVEANEAGGVILVVGLGRVSLHCCNVRVVQAEC